MKPSEILHTYQLAEARGHIPAGIAARATIATLLESAVICFHQGFLGFGEWARLESETRANRLQNEVAGQLTEAALSSLCHDVRPFAVALREAGTATTVPDVLFNARQAVMRESLNPTDSMFWQMAQKRTANDFRQMHGYTVGSIDRLLKRARGADVKKTKLTQTKDTYSIANYELALEYFWEDWVNDEAGAFTIGATNMGIAARRTRGLIVFEAIRAGLTGVTLDSAVGGPTYTRIAALKQALAEQTTTSGTATTKYPCRLTDIAYPTKWDTDARRALNSENLITGASSTQPAFNPAYKVATPHDEPMMGEIFVDDDWLGWDASKPWLEVATLRGFEGGPLTYTQMPDVMEHIDQGSFANHSIAMKVGDACGAQVINDKSVIRVNGT